MATDPGLPRLRAPSPAPTFLRLREVGEVRGEPMDRPPVSGEPRTEAKREFVVALLDRLRDRPDEDMAALLDSLLSEWEMRIAWDRPPVSGEPQVLWQGHYGNYDDSAHTALFTTPVECLKSIGHIDRDGRPIDVRGDNIHWSLEAMPVYEDWEQARHDETDWDGVAWRALWEHWVLPLYIRKYEDGRRLDVHEQTVLGLR